MFKSQSGLDRLTAAIESALGGRGGSNTSSGCSADENDFNCSNGTENGGPAPAPAKRAAAAPQQHPHQQQHAYCEQVIMHASAAIVRTH